MLRTTTKVMISVLIALGLMMPGFEQKAEAKGKKKVGFFTRVARQVKRDVKRTVKKTKRAVVKTGAAIQNGVMDSAVKAKSAVTGKKPKKTFVKGNYKKGQKTLTNGHFRRVRRTKKSSGGSSSSGAPGISTGSPLPPMDPSLPSMMKTTKSKSRSKK